MMGGAMWAESEGPGRGSVFSFQIEFEAAPITQRKTARDIKGLQPKLEGKRVLIVDDNATNRRILMRQSEKWGMTAVETGAPGEALKWLQGSRRFDLAIFDMQMPDIDGVGLAREVRRVPRRQKMPIILLTSLGWKEAGSDDAEFAAYLTKPLKPSALFDALAAIFAQDTAARRQQCLRQSFADSGIGNRRSPINLPDLFG